ncbi:hypothetical protein [Virgibacillus litoralis]|uniref:Phosphatase n=1 Tax=Virgibacillus litoralis TaxID=578221 RepID=A0ABS4HD38_9BACI|nr:hypothetical protein [Virgibacillus litoralis]MBP1948834.1 hypothetical protein [Virgibacillus litoralis]
MKKLAAIAGISLLILMSSSFDFDELAIDEQPNYHDPELGGLD